LTDGDKSDMAGDLREYRTAGNSMRPFIPPGSRLFVAPVCFAEIRKGDVICYIGEQKECTAHRVTRIVDSKDERLLFVRGDAQDTEESVRFDAVMFIVKRAACRGLAYDMDGPAGRLFARIALAESKKAASAKAAFRYAENVVSRGRRLARKMLQTLTLIK
jgi:hypothetical protein